MIFPTFHSSNHHSVTLYGRLFFQVSSASRAGLDHFVDLERTNYPDGEGKDRYYNSICTCEAWKYGERPCRHIAASFEAVAEWANVNREHREEWIERLMFLLNMGQSFREALESEAMQSLRSKPEPEAPKRRDYIIKMDRQTGRLAGRNYETPTANPQRAKRRLPARLRRQPPRNKHQPRA